MVGPSSPADTHHLLARQQERSPSADLYPQFNYAWDPDAVVADLSRAHVWDAATAARHGRLTGQLP